jgi:hypothetical protein
MKARASDLVWLVKPHQMLKWSFELQRRDVGRHLDLSFTVKVGEDWIPMLSPHILGAKDANRDQCIEVVV